MWREQYAIVITIGSAAMQVGGDDGNGGMKASALFSFLQSPLFLLSKTKVNIQGCMMYLCPKHYGQHINDISRSEAEIRTLICKTEKLTLCWLHFGSLCRTEPCEPKKEREMGQKPTLFIGSLSADTRKSE